MTELGVQRGQDHWISWMHVTWVMFAFTLYAGLTMVTNVPFYSFKDVQMKNPSRSLSLFDCTGIAIINIHRPLSCSACLFSMD